MDSDAQDTQSYSGLDDDGEEQYFEMDDLLEDVRIQVKDFLKNEGPKIIQQEVKKQVTALIKSEIGTLRRQGAVLDLTQTECDGSTPTEKSSKNSKLIKEVIKKQNKK